MLRPNINYRLKKMAVSSKFSSKALVSALLISALCLPAYADNVSQQFSGDDSVSQTLSKVLPEINYTTDDLSTAAMETNTAIWQPDKELDRATTARIQALLNWHQHGVGAVDGYWGMNTRAAMQNFQKAHNLAITDDMNSETWDALMADSTLKDRPVLINYQVQDSDVNIQTTNIPGSAEAKGELEGMYYESVMEAIAEKFHMDVNYFQSLNTLDNIHSGDHIIVYNPGMPNTTAVSRVLVDKDSNTLFAYDESDTLVASYPTTVGSTATPSPSGTHTVEVKVHEPNYTFTDDNGEKTIIPPGPNNPVGLVWVGLSKPSYGIHGSPDPERISRQASAGCVRLTNWDALALYGTIQRGAVVEFN